MCSCKDLYGIEAVKGNQILPGGGWAGEFEWSGGDNIKMYCSREQAMKERDEIPKDAWPEEATELVIFGFLGPEAR